MHVKLPVHSLAHVSTLLTIIAAIVIRWVWPCVTCMCPTCTVLYARVYMNPGVCAQGMWKGVIPGLRDKGKDMSLPSLTFGSGLPSCAHRCACVLMSVHFEATGLGTHCASRDQGSPVPLLHLFCCQPRWLRSCCPCPPHTLPVEGRPWE